MGSPPQSKHPTSNTQMAAVEQAKINMTVEQHTPVAAALSKPTNKIQQQTTKLTVQVAALSAQQSINNRGS